MNRHWGTGVTNDIIFTTCGKKENPTAPPAPLIYPLDEDEQLTGIQLNVTDKSVKSVYILEGTGKGKVTMTDINDGYFDYKPLLDSDLQDKFQFVTTDGEVTSPVQDVIMKIYPIADDPKLKVTDIVGWEDYGPFNLNITAKLTDIDGSETLTVAICNCYEADSDADGKGDRYCLCSNLAHEKM